MVALWGPGYIIPISVPGVTSYVHSKKQLAVSVRKTLSLFDYIYYRIFKFFKEKGDSVPEFSAVLVLSIVQSLTILDFVVLVRMLYPFPLPDKIIVLPVIVGIGVMNWYRYEHNLDIEKLAYRWDNENQKRKERNGWLIGSYLLISFLIPTVYGYLEHNLKLI